MAYRKHLAQRIGNYLLELGTNSQIPCNDVINASQIGVHAALPAVLMMGVPRAASVCLMNRQSAFNIPALSGSET